MSNNFPPRTAHESEVEAAVAVLGSVAEGRGVIYVSAPITSGRRFAEWLARRNGGGGAAAARADEAEEFRREVVDRNRAHAAEIVRALRRECAGVLVDPTALEDLPGWTQDDYRDLWARVVARHARQAVFLDGWSYSNGCAYEFLVARRAGVETLDESRRPLSREEGARLIGEAVAELRARALPTDFLEHVLEEMRAADGRETETPCKI